MVHNVMAYHRGQVARSQRQRGTFRAKPLIQRIYLFTGGQSLLLGDFAPSEVHEMGLLG